jgi:hypothetical protein
MEDELSPDGRTLVRWSESDGRMSHVIRTPSILDAATGERILQCRDSGFDASIGWRDDGGFDIDLRHYWRAGTLRVTVDRAAGTFRMAGVGEAQPYHKLGELSAFVEAHFQAADREAMKKGPTGPLLEDRLEHGLRSNKRALWLMLAIGLTAAIWASFFRR